MNIKKLFGYALGPFGSAAASAVSLPLISWYFPVDDIGRIVLLQTVSSLILIVLGMGLDQAYIREYHATTDRYSLLKTVSVLPLALTVAVVALIGIFRPTWPSEIILSLKSTVLGWLSLLFLAGMMLIRFMSIILRMQERSYAFSFSQLTPKLLILTFILVYMLLGTAADTFYLLFAYTAAQILTVVVLFLQTRRETKRAVQAMIDRSMLKTNLHYGIPLVLGGLAYWGLVSVDRFLLKQYGNLAELGIYSMAISFGSIALIFQSIFSTIWSPMVFKWVNEGITSGKLNNIVATMLALIAAILCLAGLFSPLIPLLLPQQYAPVQFILLSSILFPLFYTLMEVTGIGINVSKKTWLITLCSLFALLCNMALCSWLIPLFGAKGAAMSTAVSFWLFFILKTEASIRLWQPLPRLSVYGTTAVFLLVSLTYTYFGNHSNYPVFALAWFAYLIILTIKHKTALQQFIFIIKSRLNPNRPL